MRRRLQHKNVEARGIFLFYACVGLLFGGMLSLPSRRFLAAWRNGMLKIGLTLGALCVLGGCEERPLRVLCASESVSAFERRWAEFVSLRPEYSRVRMRLWVRPDPLPREAAAWGWGHELLAIPASGGACLASDSLAYFEYGGVGKGVVLPSAPSSIYAAAVALADSLVPGEKRIFAFEYAMYSAYARLGARGGIAYASEARKWGARVVFARPCPPHSLFLGAGVNSGVAKEFYEFVSGRKCGF